MNFAPRTYRMAAGVLLAAVTALAGAWWGTRQAQPNLSELPNTLAASNATPPIIPLPPPLFRAEPPAPSAAPGPAAGVPGTATPSPADIQPAGLGGNAMPTDLLWETTASQPWQVRPQPITPPNWYITGVVRRGEQTQVIVQFDGEPMPRMFKVGDTLPGGARLGWVRPNAIGVITSTKKTLDVPVLGGDPASRVTPATPASRTSPSTHR